MRPDVALGDTIEIKYCADEAGRARWMQAHIIDCEADSWPLAQLSDGQFTEIRPFMEWRHVARAASRGTQAFQTVHSAMPAPAMATPAT